MEKVPVSVLPPAPVQVGAEELQDPFVSQEHSNQVVLLVSSSVCS